MGERGVPVGEAKVNPTPDGAGAPQAADTATRDELRDVEEELARLRAEVGALHGLLGGRDAGPMDLAESAAAITAAEEQEALLEVLEARRETLQRKLGIEP